MVSKESAKDLKPMLSETNSEIDRAISDGATSISYIVDLEFKLGSIQYLMLDLLLILLVFQNNMRPNNQCENNLYSRLIQILFLLAGIRLSYSFWMT